MALPPGTRLGSYEIIGSIGAGGMGEVYRAHDTSLDRDVAIKVLPPDFAKDADRVMRFDREAKSLAALNHPNIAQIYGLERGTHGTALVMELVDGDDLSARIAGGPLAIDEAVPLARQVCDALEAAHEAALVHRDLKPGNIRVRPDGTVKVLDFGLARSASDGPLSESMANSPTFTSPAMTAAGVILGTAAYMSPEQARGKVVDKRTDIWAFGCVLYEMLAGHPAFAKDDLTLTLAAIVRDEPDWSKLPANTPSGIHRAIRRCLAKDPRQRARDIGDVRMDLAEVDPPTATTAAPTRRAFGLLPAIAACALVAAAAFMAGQRWPSSSDLPHEWIGEHLGGPPVAFEPVPSPDGTTIAFSAMVDRNTQIAVMRPETGDWRVLTRASGRGYAGEPMWSADGTTIYFHRMFDGPAGVYSISMLGGDERLVIEQAMAPHPLPDGSLLVTRLNPERILQLHRVWPASNRIEPLPVLFRTRFPIAPVRVMPDGTRIVYFGSPASETSVEPHLHLLDLISGADLRLVPSLTIDMSWFFPLEVTPDGRYVIFNLPSGGANRLVAARPDGSDSLVSLQTMTAMPLHVRMSVDGSLLLDQVFQAGELLRYAPDTGVDRLPVDALDSRSQLALPGERYLVEHATVGRRAVMVLKPGQNPAPFVQTPEPTRGPFAYTSAGRVAMLAGAPGSERLIIVNADDGRIVQRLAGFDAANVAYMAGSVDGRTLYCVQGGELWSVPIDAGMPVRLRRADSVAVDPNGRDLLVATAKPGGAELTKVSLTGDNERSVPWSSTTHRLLPSGLNGHAIGRDGRIAVRLAATDSWYWPAGILDPVTGKVTLPYGVDADMGSPIWDFDGRLVTTSSRTFSSIWRFKPVK